ncbi:MAG: efflux RND transporter permease subunit [Planctomycetota bacterium]
MRSVIRWAVHNHAAMNLILIATFLVGAVSLLMLRREVFPAFQLEIAVVTVPYPGASPEEVEEAICQKVEAAVRAIEGIKNVTSTARESAGSVILEMESTADVQKVIADVRSAVDRIPSFPVLAEDPEIQQITFRNAAIRVGILSDKSDAADADLTLRGFAEQIRDDLLQLNSVSQSTILGERPYQIDVEIPEENLRKYGLTLQKVAERIRRENVEIPGGKIQASGQSMLIRGKNKRVTGEEIAQLPLVAREDGAVLTVGALGTVHDGFEDTKSYQRLNGKVAQVVSVDRTNTEDLLKIVDEVQAYVKNKQCPPGYSLITMYDTSVDVRERINLLVEDGLQGLILVILVLAIFLEFRLALWVALGIPFAIMATCGVLYLAGETLNMLSLFAFLMALGILVDDAIVISENFHTYRSQGHSVIKSAIDATAEVAGSVTTGVLCTCIAFVPLFFVSGIMGKFIACMPLTVIAMLLISLAEGLTILACHLGHDHMLPEMIGTMQRLRDRVGSWHFLHFILFGWLIWGASWLCEQLLRSWQSGFRLFKRFFDWVNIYADKLVDFTVGAIYLPTVRRAVRNIPLVLAVAATLLIVTLTGQQAGVVKQTLFPSMDSRTIIASVTFPDGTPIEVTDAAVSQMAEAMREVSREHSEEGYPLAKIVHELIGGGGGFSNGPNERGSGEFAGTVIVELVGADHRKLHSKEVINLWREKTGTIVGAEEVNFNAASMGPGGKQIEFRLLANSENWDQLKAANEEVKQKLSSYADATDISDDLFEGKWEYIIRVNDRAQGMGVTTADLAETLRASFYGQEVQRLQRGRHEVKLMVRYPKDERENLATLDSIRVRGNDGVERPIVELAEVSIQRGYQSINRIDQKRAITISGDVRPGGNSTELLNNFEKNDMPAILAKYPAVSVKWEGQRQQNAESMMSLGVGAILAIFAMYLMLVFQMKSLLEPFIILLVIPFAISGAFWGHYAMGLELTLFSFFGIVALTGMVVNDSIVLIDFIDLRIKEFPDEPLIESIVEAGRRRIRPMALNTLTAIIGIVPLVSNKSLQAQVLVPMGVSLVFGLAASTLVGLFLIPTLYYMLAQIFPPHRESDEDYEEQQDTAEVQATNAWGRQSIPGGIPTPENTDAGQTAASTALDAASLLAGLKNGAERTKPLDLPVEIGLAAGPNRP